MPDNNVSSAVEPLLPVELGAGRIKFARGVKAGRWVVGKIARELGINATGGSSSMADAWEVVRMAAATARAAMLGAASLQWKQRSGPFFT